MNILAIETSCDETSVAVVQNGVTVMSLVTYSQIDLHVKTSGVVPEVASREHSIKIIPCIEEALKQSAYTKHDIDALAVTVSPGLIGSLLVGIQTAKALSYAWNKPCIEVNHIHGHIYSAWLDRTTDCVDFPAVVLTASGGHNDLYLMKGHMDFTKLGSTIDDAAGEAFDKVARLLDLPYPGGPEIERLAKNGNPEAFNFPRPMLRNGYDYSFSGLKTAVKYAIRDLGTIPNSQQKADIAASFQKAVIDVLTYKCMKAVKEFQTTTVLLVGGVSANTSLRDNVDKECQKCGVSFLFPAQMKYCVDNAAMIGAAGFFDKNFD